MDYVVMARSAVLQADSRQLRESLGRLFQRLKDQASAVNDSDQPVA